MKKTFLEIIKQSALLSIMKQHVLIDYFNFQIMHLIPDFCFSFPAFHENYKTNRMIHMKNT